MKKKFLAVDFAEVLIRKLYSFKNFATLVLYLRVDKFILNQMFVIPQKWCSHSWMCY